MKHFNKECEYILCVNRALAYYLKGEKEKCKRIIGDVDWSGTENRFRLAHMVLLEKYEEAVEIMKSIGKNDEMREAYAEWPLFNNFRKNQLFKNTYKDIYGKDYEYIEANPTKWEDVIQEAVNMIKESKEHKQKRDAETKG